MFDLKFQRQFTDSNLWNHIPKNNKGQDIKPGFEYKEIISFPSFFKNAVLVDLRDTSITLTDAVKLAEENTCGDTCIKFCKNLGLMQLGFELLAYKNEF